MSDTRFQELIVDNGKDPNVDLTYELVRLGAVEFERILESQVPAGRELALAKTKLEEALLWALAGVARHGTKPSQLEVVSQDKSE